MDTELVLVVYLVCKVPMLSVPAWKGTMQVMAETNMTQRRHGKAC